MKQFFTRATANEGRKVPLFTPDDKPTEHWLMVRGTDSDAFRMAETKAKREAAELILIEDEAERVVKMIQTKREVVVSLVAGWSFDTECTPEAVTEFFIEAPHLEDMVNRVAAQRSSFFG